MGYMDTESQLPGLSGAGSQSPINLGGMTGSAQGASKGFNPLSALGGLGLEVGSAWYGNRQAQKRQREAFDQQKWMMQNRYQMQTKDLMASGLNPMLAVTQGAPMPNAPAAAKTDKPDIGQMSTIMLATAQAAKTAQETENLKTENEINLNTAAAWPTTMTKLAREIEKLEQEKATGKASEEDLKRLADLHKAQADAERQGIKMKRPEEIASGLDAATYSAMASRVLKPLIDVLAGAAKIK